MNHYFPKDKEKTFKEALLNFPCQRDEQSINLYRFLFNAGIMFESQKVMKRIDLSIKKNLDAIFRMERKPK